MSADRRPRPEVAEGREWRRRPVLSFAVRGGAVALPAVTALGIAVGLSRVLPHPRSVAGVVLWYASMAAAMLVTTLVMERAARRLLPLAALLNLSLLFPDQAPHRFAMARRIGRPRDLQHRIDELRAEAPASPELSTMQRVLELGAALSVHDRHTRGHSERVRVFADLIADEMGLSVADRARLRWASLLHDIGKLMVPAAILRKPAALSDAEWETVRRHPEEGDRIIAPLREWLGPWAAAVIEHHERWDGGGYPHGLRGTEISLGGRIVAVADSYEVMTAPRPYRRQLGVVAARRELVRCSGAQFDPAVVRAFLNISVGRLWRVVGVGTWFAQFPLLAWLEGLASPAGVAVASGVTALAVGVAPAIPVAGSLPPTPTAMAAVATPGGRTAPVSTAGGAATAGGGATASQVPSASPGASKPSPGPAAPGTSPGATPSSQPTSGISPTASASPPGPVAPAPSPTLTPAPTPTPTPTLTPTPAPTPTPTPAPSPTPSPTPAPTPAPLCILGIICL